MSKYGVFSGPYFPIFGMNTGKCGLKKTRYLDTFHAVVVLVDKLLDCDEWICFPKNSSRGNKKRHFSNYHSNGCEEGKWMLHQKD